MVVLNPSVAGRGGSVRWVIVALAFTIATVAYLDRANISVAAAFLKRDFGLTNVQLGTVFSAFILGYAATQPIAGRIADRYGAYNIIAIGILWWSAFTGLTALIPSASSWAYGTLLAVRFVLGMGEAVIFPASNRLVANWIPSQERGLANGLIFSGVGIGGAIAPPLITTFMVAYNWRLAFLASAIIGMGVLAIWLLLARDRPADHFWVGDLELAYINANRPLSSSGSSTIVVPWRSIVCNRQVVLLTLSYFCFGYVAYIFLSWFFMYLSTVRGLDLKASGLYGSLPFVAIAVAAPVGGYLSDKLTIRHNKRIGRCLVAAVGMALASFFVAMATQVQDARLASLVLAGGSGSLYLAQSGFWTLSADLGGSSAASVSGFMNMGGQIGGAITALLTPILADRLGWSGSFLCAAGVSMIGAFAWIFVDPYAELERRTDGSKK